MFIDKVRISVKAGAGGNGAVAFHREKRGRRRRTAATAATAAPSSCASMITCPR